MAATRCHNVCKVYGTSIKESKMCIVMKLYRESMNGLMRRYPEGKLPVHEVKRYASSEGFFPKVSFVPELDLICLCILGTGAKSVKR
jgi:hypothetical protein